MADKNPLIQEHTVGTLDNVRCLMCFVASLHASGGINRGQINRGHPNVIKLSL